MQKRQNWNRLIIVVKRKGKLLQENVIMRIREKRHNFTAIVIINDNEGVE